MGDEDTGKTAAELFGGGREPENTRERLLYAAMDLFYGAGFHAVGIDQLLKAVGVTKTTFYNHFESKDDLIAAVVSLRDTWESSAFSRAVQEKAGYDPRAMLLAMFDVQHDWFTHPDYKGCMFVNACAEFPSPHDPIHKAAAKHFAASEDAVRGMAEAIGIADAAEFAKEWVVLLIGAMTYRLVTGNDSIAATCRKAAERLLQQHEASS